MAVTTIYRLAEQCLSLIEGGDQPVASSISINEIKIACGQVINSLLKTEYFQVNGAIRETIPNGSVLAWYEDIAVESWNNKSMATLPIKPLKLPRNMGVFAIYPNYHDTPNSIYELDKEFIPLQMGQGGLVKSQPMINDLLGQVGYETFGDKVVFTKNIKSMFPNVVLAMRLAVMDISQYGDYDPLPILPEMEIDVINAVYKIFTGQPTAGKVVDATQAELKGTPINEQKQPE